MERNERHTPGTPVSGEHAEHAGYYRPDPTEIGEAEYELLEPATTPTNPRLDAALSHAARGWRVFPAKPRGKTPLIEQNLTRATTDAEQIRRWWEQWPDANPAIVAAGGLAVLDVDRKTGGMKSLRELLLQHGPLRTYTVRTGSGGLHLYLIDNRDNPLAQSAGKLARGLDVRAGGKGYVIAAGAVVDGPYGVKYDRDLVPVPDWLRELAGSSRTTTRAEPLPEEILEGERETHLVSLAGTLRNRGASHASILAALHAVNDEQCHPSLESADVERIARSVARYEPGHIPAQLEFEADPLATPTAPRTLPGFGERDAGFTDTGFADRLIGLHGERLRYVAAWNRWLVWDDSRWHIDTGAVHVKERAKDVGQQLLQLAATAPARGESEQLRKAAWQALSAARINSMVDLARGIPGVAVEHEELDADPWLLGVRNGAVDLRTGALLPPDPSRLMTMACPVAYDPAARAPRWEQALREWFPDPEVRAYVQRLAGAALHGGQRDHVFVIDFGGGRNGKGTYMRAVQRVLGPYAVTAHMGLLVASNEQHDTVRAHLFRARLAVASETRRRVALKEESIKTLTGGDRIQARRMREDPWEFDPSHMLRLQTNHLPEIAGTDEGIWRRIRVVEWVQHFAGSEDPDLDAKLAAESAGILRWTVEGCLAWQRQGLAEPASVVQATLKYRQAEDKCARFAADRLQLGEGLQVSASELAAQARNWAQENDLRLPLSELHGWLEDQGCRKRHREAGKVWSGVAAQTNEFGLIDPEGEVVPSSAA
jgi:putative DNA primase/helicase